MDADQIRIEYIKEKIKANYEQIKIYAAALLGIGAASVSAFLEFDFSKEIYDIDDMKLYWTWVIGFIFVAVLLVVIANMINDSNVLIRQIRNIEPRHKT